MLSYSRIYPGFALVHLARHGVTAGVRVVDQARVHTDNRASTPRRVAHLLPATECTTLEYHVNHNNPVVPATRAELARHTRRGERRGEDRCSCWGLSYQFHADPDVSALTDVEKHLTFTYWVDELLAHRARDRFGFIHLEVGIARVLTLIHADLPPVDPSTHGEVAALVESQAARLAAFKPRWRVRRPLRRWRPGAASWVRIDHLPLSHLAGSELGERDQVLLAAIGAAPECHVLPRRSGGGLLVAAPVEFLTEYRRWDRKGLDEIGFYGVHDAAQVTLALQLLEASPDANIYDLLGAARAATT